MSVDTKNYNCMKNVFIFGLGLPPILFFDITVLNFDNHFNFGHEVQAYLCYDLLQVNGFSSAFITPRLRCDVETMEFAH